MIFDERTVIVLDLGQYKEEYKETVPFIGICKECYQDGTIIVESKTTRQEYELYINQIIEGLDIEEIKNLINLKNYGV